MGLHARYSETRALDGVTGDIVSRLSRARGRRDEEPNVQLAEELARSNDVDGIARVAEIAITGGRQAQSDAIKVLYEVGARNAVLLRPHMQCFLQLIESRNNRMVWRAMTALAQLASVDADPIAANLDAILAAADTGSAIAKDQAMQILIALKARPDLARGATVHLLARLKSAAVNQLPMYAERIHGALEARDYPEFRKVLMMRLADHMPKSKRRRIETIMRKLG